ncbi:hypothetical protein A323_gp21 [Acinetobacter phage AP22]|uniref:Uncharacterized protein n=2 Tax=Obolenskvirus TaxID=1915205 RepID=I2GUC8_9CAUD|nr:hypothetical protein A323_gp21 [Acinetobacter phage AP22]CCH57729.1 hypothetical protein [Acinetobacter phage AP22]
MIKAEVVFDEHQIELNNLVIKEAQDGSIWYVEDEDYVVLAQFRMLEEAIKYCMEN